MLMNIEQKMIMKVFNFNDIKISKVMKKISDVVVIDSDMDFEDAQDIVKKQQYTRYPVYDKIQYQEGEGSVCTAVEGAGRVVSGILKPRI